MATERADFPQPGRGARFGRAARCPTAWRRGPATGEPRRAARVRKNGPRTRGHRGTRRHGAAPASHPRSDGVQLRAPAPRGLLLPARRLGQTFHRYNRDFVLGAVSNGRCHRVRTAAHSALSASDPSSGTARAAAAEAAPTGRATDAADRVRRDSCSSPPADREVPPLGLTWSSQAWRLAATVLARNLRSLGKVRPWVLKFRPRARNFRPTPLSGILFSSASCRTEPKARLASRMRFANSCSSSHFS